MSDVLLDGIALTAEQVRDVARDGGRVLVHPDGATRAGAAHRTVAALSAAGGVYGRTTGVGANRLIAVEYESSAGPVILGPEGSVVTGDSAPQQPVRHDPHGLRLLRSHAGGAGPLLDPISVRAMLTVRLNQLAAGGSGVAPDVLIGLETALNRGLTPPVHAFGGIGTGDLPALAVTALCLLGEVPWRGGSMEPVPFDPADALSFISSNAGSIGEAALACADLSELLRAGTVITALAFLACDGNSEAYEAVVHLARPHPGQQTVAARLRDLLAGQAVKPARIQDPYSYRAVPQVHGPALDAVVALERTLGIELNAPAENPLVDPVGNRVLHNANFHTAYLGLALDAMRNALYQTAALSVARLSLLLEPAFTGLTPFLAAGPPGSSGLMILEYVAHSALGALRLNATPTSLATAVVSRGVEEHAPFSSQAARNSLDAVASYRVVLATELVAAVRALRMRGAAPVDGPLADAYRYVAERLPDRLDDRPLDQDVEDAAALLPALARFEG
ncbi:aromatic amino acid ammonia-lyase [Cryptosporangium aurantiacum]|uniref:Histidine ammonia-lyase n=1 Tax=Cryptosporangium aurantiacum TaxID=134849 RepID=A0A1M7PTA5_9ACTN|nr:aromatic amino acid ammonia-lyase [Cryptosporangium aurantiacum]SHN20719.1 histidine ammonia-lyase [Cryptosporangium aurantiacum]